MSVQEHLFVYGTLNPDLAPDEIAETVRHLTPLGPGSVRGKLYQFDEYPALVLSEAEQGLVQGVIYRIPSDPGILARLDEYEEYEPSNPRRSLFRRVLTTAVLPNGRKKRCWIYVYNGKLPKSAA